MYRGFKLNIDQIVDSSLSGTTIRRVGERIYEGDKKTVVESLSQHVLSNNYLNGSGLQKSWFPQLHADIFISHAHKDKDLAISISGWLYNNLGITSFVDSCVWGYGDDLLREIDDVFCKNSNNSNYDYSKRNLSTSHVHMIMASAISSMIDRTECLFFLNSPNSVSYDSGKSKTESPWLYLEIGQSAIIRRRFPNRKSYEQRNFSNSLLEKSLGAEFSIDLSHLSAIDLDDLEQWYDKCCLDEDPGKSLDTFYKLFPGKKISNQING